MKKSEKRDFIQRHTNLTVEQLAELLSTTKREIVNIARELGIPLAGQRLYGSRAHCNPPYSCDTCPYPDCINSLPATKDETQFVIDALGIERNGKKKRKEIAIV